jgi:3D (Asp-Asp-Asp) domain-containing protein
MLKYLIAITALLGAVLFGLGWNKPNPYLWDSIEVTVTAYNSVPSQTNSQPFLAAWSDTLKPGQRAVAVSRDLIPMGLDHRTEVHLEGLGTFDGKYTVLDKTNRRFKKRIDLYFGLDIQAAREFGVQKATAYWRGEEFRLADNILNP